MLAPVGIGLDQEAEIRDQRHAPVRRADRPFPFRLPALDLYEEHAPRVEERIEIQGREDPLARMGGPQRDDAGGQRRQVVCVERPPAAEPGIADVTVSLTRQVNERVRQELLDVHPDGRHAATREREQAVAGQRQQRAVLRDGRFPGVAGGAHHRVVARREHEVAGRGQARFDAQVYEAAGRRIERDALQHGGVAFGGIHRQRERFGLREHLLRDFAGRTPPVVAVAPPAGEAVARQKPCPHAGAERLGVRPPREGHHCRLQGIASGVPDDRRGDPVDAKVGLAVGYAHVGEQPLFERAVTVGGFQARVHGDGREVLALRDGDDVRVHEGAAVMGSVLDPEAERACLRGRLLLRSHGERQAALEAVTCHGVREAEA